MIEEQLRDLESSLACRVCLHSLLRDCVGEDMQSTDALVTATRTQLHTCPYTHACTHTSKYIIINAQKVSEVTMTSPNHAFQCCHDYVCSAAIGRTCFAAHTEASLWQASARMHSVLICRDVCHYGQYYHVMHATVYPCARLLQPDCRELA